MPKIKSEKLPSIINSNISSHFIPLQPAPVAPVDDNISIDISSQLNEILVFPNNPLLNEEENLLINDPPYKLTLSLKDLLSPARKTRKNKNKSDDKVPRPQNAWVLFRKDYEANQRANFPDKALKMKNVSTDAGEVWRNHPIKVKRYFETLSRLAHAQHKILYPNYKYNPKKKSIKEIIPKDWIFKDGSVVKQSSTPTNVEEEDQESFVPYQTDVDHSSQQSKSPLLTPEESWNSPITINSPISPSTTFVSPSNLYYSSVTSILAYSEETLASAAYYNYQQNFTVSNDNNLNQSNSDYQQLINLADTSINSNDTNDINNTNNINNTIFINDDMISQNFWQYTPTFSNFDKLDSVSSFDIQEQQEEQQEYNTPVVTSNNCDVLIDDNLMGNLSDLSSYDDDVHYFF
jgi:hypothetical protein